MTKLLLLFAVLTAGIVSAAPQCSRCAHRTITQVAFHNPLRPDAILAALTFSVSSQVQTSAPQCPHLQMVQYYLSKHPGATKPTYGNTHVTVGPDGAIQRSHTFGTQLVDDSMMSQSDWSYFWGTCACGEKERAQCGWFM
jgi:hypothetical protein